MRTRYYIDGLLRQASAAYARQYLGIENAAGQQLNANFNSLPLTCGYLIQNTPVWNDVRIPMSSLRAGAAAPSPQNFIVSGPIAIRAYQFRNGFTERLEFELQIPHGLNPNPIYGVRLHIHWSCQSATSPNTVGWYVDAATGDIGGVLGGAATYGPVTGLTTVPYEHVVTPIHTFTGLAESALIVGNLYRNIGDSYAGNDVFGLSLDAHYVVQQTGSLEEIP